MCIDFFIIFCFCFIYAFICTIIYMLALATSFNSVFTKLNALTDNEPQ